MAARNPRPKRLRVRRVVRILLTGRVPKLPVPAPKRAKKTSPSPRAHLRRRQVCPGNQVHLCQPPLWRKPVLLMRSPAGRSLDRPRQAPMLDPICHPCSTPFDPFQISRNQICLVGSIIFGCQLVLGVGPPCANTCLDQYYMFQMACIDKCHGYI